MDYGDKSRMLLIVLGLAIVFGVGFWMSRSMSTAHQSPPLLLQESRSTDGTRPETISTSPATTSPSKANMIAPADSDVPSPNSRNTEDTTGCTKKVESMKKSYESEVRKARTLLDSKMSYPIVGSLISSGYIEDYNRKVARTYQQLVNMAQHSGCRLPIAIPLLLPDSYHP